MINELKLYIFTLTTVDIELTLNWTNLELASEIGKVRAQAISINRNSRRIPF